MRYQTKTPAKRRLRSVPFSKWSSSSLVTDWLRSGRGPQRCRYHAAKAWLGRYGPLPRVGSGVGSLLAVHNSAPRGTGSLASGCWRSHLVPVSRHTEMVRPGGVVTDLRATPGRHRQAASAKGVKARRVRGAWGNHQGSFRENAFPRERQKCSQRPALCPLVAPSSHAGGRSLGLALPPLLT